VAAFLPIVEGERSDKRFILLKTDKKKTGTKRCFLASLQDPLTDY
jgi:hypothetical protein